MEPGDLTVVVSESSDLAYNVGGFRMVLDNPDGKVEFDMKCTVIWRESDGAWKVAVNSCRSGLALT
jgi:ketosteroid isomerase-like protein